MWRELSEMETDDCACAPTWFTGPQNATAKAIRDRRDLIAEVERLREALGYYSQPYNQGWDRGARALAVLAKLQEQKP